MIELLITCVYTLACVGMGQLALSALAGHEWPPLSASSTPHLAGRFILGQAVLAAIWVPIGLVGWFGPVVIVGTLATVIGLSASQLFPLLRNTLSWVRSFFKWLRGERVGVQLFAMALALLIFEFGAAAWIMPPRGDAEAFYIPYARVIAATQRIELMPGPYEYLSSIGLMGELHFGALISLANVSSAKFFVFPLAVSAAAMLVAICSEAGVGRMGRMIAVAMLFTTTAFTHHIFDGKTDLFPTALGLMAVWLLLAAGESVPVRTAYAVAGLCTGFALMAKFSYALGFLPAVCVFLVWRQLTNGTSIVQVSGSKFRSGAMVVFAVCAVAATVPHLAKNAVLFSSPLAPFLGGSEDKGWLNQAWFTPEVTRRIVLSYPFALVFGRYPGQSGNLSYLLLAFLPLAAWLPRPTHLSKSKLTELCLAGAIGTISWIAVRPSMIAPRYYLPTLLLFYPLAAKAAEQVLIKEAPFRWLGAGIMAILLSALAVFSYPLLPAVRQVPNALLGRLDPCVLASPYCEPLITMNRQAEPGDRIYFAGYYSNWLRTDLLQCRNDLADSQALETATDAAGRWAMLYARGFRYVIIDNTSRLPIVSLLDPSTIPPWLNVNEILKTKELSVLRLSNRAHDQKVERDCVQDASHMWHVKRVS